MEAIVVVDGTAEYFFGQKKEYTLNTNHEYLIVGLAPSPKFRLLFEVLDRTYWELQYQHNSNINIKAGKVAIPFGPIFLHQILAGIVEKPLPGGGSRHFLVPHVWAEYGLIYEQRMVDAFAYSLMGKFWVTNGLQGNARPLEKTVDFTSSGGEIIDNNRDKALGLRLQQKFYGKYGLNFSFYTTKWRNEEDDQNIFYGGDRLLLGNLDSELGYNSIPFPFLKNFRIRAEYALMRTRALEADPALKSKIPWHNKSASLLEFTYNKFAPLMHVQFRYGTYDDNWDILNSRDLVNYNVALYFELVSGVHIIPMYMWNKEKVNEVKDDFFFFKFFLEL